MDYRIVSSKHLIFKKSTLFFLEMINLVAELNVLILELWF